MPATSGLIKGPLECEHLAQNLVEEENRLIAALKAPGHPKPLLAGAAHDLGLMQAGNARDGGDHHAGEELHSCYIALVEGAGR